MNEGELVYTWPGELAALRTQNAELVATLLQVRAYAPPDLQSRINAALAAEPASGEEGTACLNAIAHQISHAARRYAQARHRSVFHRRSKYKAWSFPCLSDEDERLCDNRWRPPLKDKP